MNILSLFNGLGGLPLACYRAGIKVETCYYSEIDKYANKVMGNHYPDAIALGDVTKWREWDIDWSEIGLVGAGFPCQAWSVAGKQLGDKDERGMLFWTTLEIIANVLKHNPSAKFLMENVKMKKDFEQYITHHTEQALGKVEKTLINSALVSAQNRQRYYWTNFAVTQPDDKGVLLKDILEDGVNNRDKSQTILATIYKENAKSMVKRNKMGLVVRATVQANAEHTYNGKVPTLTAAMGVGGGNVPLITDAETAAKYKGKYVDKNERLEYRKLTPLECERLQTFPDNWTDCISNTQRYKSLGNAWTIDVIAHILKCI